MLLFLDALISPGFQGDEQIGLHDRMLENAEKTKETKFQEAEKDFNANELSSVQIANQNDSNVKFVPEVVVHQLKTEILFEMRKLMESVVATQTLQQQTWDLEKDEKTQVFNDSMADTTVSTLQKLQAKLTQCSPCQKIVTRDAITISKQSLENPLGNGQFATVYKGLLHLGKGRIQQVAIKKIKWKGVHENIVESFLREVKVFGMIDGQHPNIIDFWGACCHTGM